MVEEAVAMVEAVAASLAAISVGLRGIVLPTMASHNTKERTLRGTKIISDTIDISLLEIHLGMITHTTGMIIRTTAIMTTMPATIPMDNPYQPK
jgi:hypothetical protein